MAGQRLESERFLLLMTENIRKLLGFDDIRAEAMRYIDEFIALWNEFDANFSNPTKEANWKDGNR